MTRVVRPHQEASIRLLRESLRTGHRRPLLQIPTAGGKTYVATLIIESARERDKRVLFLVDAISLIDQTVAAFYEAGLHSISVIQSDHVMQDWSKPLQIASVPTLQRRRAMPPAELVIVDEAHRRNAWLHGLMAREEWAKIPFIGLSATPWSRGLGNVYDDLIIPVTMRELIDQGYLSHFRVYAVAHPDLTGVKTVGGDYHEAQLAEVMSDGGLVADIVMTWMQRSEGRPTIAFCVDRAHAKKVQLRFEQAGVPWGYIDAYTTREERTAIQRQLDAGEISGVANVGCLTTGVDWKLGCIILARPTKSEILYVQMIGRGLRVNEGIPDCLVLDHSDTTLRLGFVDDINHPTLCTAKKGEKKPPAPKPPTPTECPKCSFLKPAKTQECPACGFKPERSSHLEEAEGELVPVTKRKSKTPPTRAEQQSWLAQLTTIARTRTYASGWPSQTFRKKFGHWPDGLDRNATAPVTQEVSNYVTGTMIRHAKRRVA